MVKPGAISKVFGENLGLPDRVAALPGSLAGPSVTCTYRGKTRELTINSYEYPAAAKSSQSWQIRRTRDLASKRAAVLAGVGDGAYCLRYSIQSHQGIHDDSFSAAPSRASVKRDWKEALVTVSRLF